MKLYCYGKLDDLLPHHRLAFQHTETLSYDCSYSWFNNLISSTYNKGEEIKIFVAEDENGQIAVLPMYYLSGNLFKSRTLRTLSNFYTSLYAPILSNEKAIELLPNVFHEISQGQLACDAIELKPLSLEHDTYVALFNALKYNGFLTFKYFCFDNWYLLVSGRTFEEYFRGLPSRLRNTVNRKRKQFIATGEARLEIVTDGDQLDSKIEDYIKVYNSSWKVHEPFPGFMPGLIRLCAKQGWLRLGFAYFQDRPIAAQIWIVAHDRAAIYKLAHDAQYDTYSVGSVLTAHMMQYVINIDKVKEVDYLIGDDNYKKDWMSHHRGRWGIVAYNPRTLLGILGAFKQVLGNVRRMLLSRIREINAN